MEAEDRIRIESVEVIGLSEPIGAMKSLTLRVTECADKSRLGTGITMLVPASFDVDLGFVGKALWVAGEQLPKLVLHPAGK